MAEPHDDDNDQRALRGRAGESPDRVELPFWLDACIILDPPVRNGKPRAARHAIYPVAHALVADRINARGDESVRLDRNVLARWAGYDHAKNASWIFDYLQRVGFLEIHKNPAVTGQRPDTFDVFITPPANYVGPATYAEVNMALRAQEEGRRVRLFSQVKPSSAREEAGGSPMPAHAELGQVKPSSAHEEAGGSPMPAHAELGQVKPSSAREEAASKEEIFDLSERREIEDLSNECDAAPLREADGVALGGTDDELTSSVRALVRRLPWERTTRGRTPEVMADANKTLVPAIVSAIRNSWVTLDQAQQHALCKIEKAEKNPVVYVANGFKADRIPLPTPEDVLALAKQPTPAPVAANEPSSGGAPIPAEYATRELTSEQRQASNEARDKVLAELRTSQD